ncbi:uracil-DNA glycosylase [Pseudonocardia ailaonensis]|uniref:Uracil-DNA glycosylase n=1 Tax=Pseudonocardia ailaonensis TaxID=367279 RepID=A0ABN2MVM0_9PSEU
MTEFDPGPPAAIAAHLDTMPSWADHRELFWYDWGPVHYRGRLDGSARLLCVASDPGPTERIACRTLVGDAGQRVQGFLRKVGLTRSYLAVNAFALALRPSQADEAGPLLAEPARRTWWAGLVDAATGPALEAVVAFGAQAQHAVSLWDSRPAVPLFEVPHPSSRDPERLATEWAGAVTELRDILTPDPDGDVTGANYGATLVEADYAPIPPRDLPYGLPAWFGDDAWGRAATPRHNNSVARPSADSLHSLLWQAPPDQP